jgi:hypothetical protein
VRAVEQRRWLTFSNPYALAVPLSLASAVLGLIREGLILGKLGLSLRNDELQYYLSVTFTISLFGDAIRLGTANLAQRASSVAILAPVALTAVTVGVATAAWFATHAQWTLAGAIPMAALAGTLNLAVVSLIVIRQRQGRFLPAHVVTVLPNVLILLGVLAAFQSDAVRFLRVIVGLFLLAPLVQIATLLALRPGTRRPGLAEAGASLPARLRLLGPHGAGAVGNQIGQAVIRTALALASPGTLSLYAFLARVVDSVRAVFLDSFIGSRLADWAEGETKLPRLLHAARLRPGFAAAVALLSLAGVAVAQSQPVGWRLGLGLGVILLVGAWFSFTVRVGMFAVNTSSIPPRLNWQLALIDLGLAGVVAAGWYVHAAAVLFLLWLFAVARPLLQLSLVRLAVHP